MNAIEAAKIACDQIHAPGKIASVIKDGIAKIERQRDRAIEIVSVIEKCLRQLQLDNPDSLASWPNESGTTTYRTIEDWVDYVIDKARSTTQTNKIREKPSDF